MARPGQIEIPFVKGNSFTFVDKDGKKVLDVNFDMDPGGHLISVEAFDTEGHAVGQFGVDYLGVGYPQYDGPDKPPLIVEKVIRKRAKR